MRYTFEDYELDYDDLPVCNIIVEQWDSMSEEDQEEYIRTNSIKVLYTHDISDTLSRGFGKMDEWGFCEYQCKNNGEPIKQ